MCVRISAEIAENGPNASRWSDCQPAAKQKAGKAKDGWALFYSDKFNTRYTRTML
jgi:hypothetical protein